MKYYVVDSFAEHVFEGNPAAVCIMDKWLSAETMLNIAIENNLSETAFAVREGEKYRIRWFTPGGEVDLCGHATLATAFVILNFYEKDAPSVTFITAEHGELFVEKQGDLLEMEFPVFKMKEIEVTDLMEDVIGVRPLRAFLGRDMVCILENEDLVRNNQPDMAKMMELDGLLLHITAKGEKYDCVSRSYGPKLKIPEDPVCGSGHCHIVPVWNKLENEEYCTAYQASRRGGTLYCKMLGNTMKLAGKAVLYAEGNINIPQEVTKKLVDCENQAAAVAIIGQENGEVIEVVPSGVEVVNDKNDYVVYDMLAQDFNVKFCKDCKREDFHFYTVPRFTVFATDSYGNAIGTLYGAGDMAESDYPVAMVTKDNKGHILANSFKEFIAGLLHNFIDIRVKYGFEGFVPTANKDDNAKWMAQILELENQQITDIVPVDFEIFASKEEAEKKYEFIR